MHRKEMSLFVYPQYHCMNSIIYIYIVLSGIVLKRDVEKLFVICPCRTSAMSTGYLGQPDQGLHFVYIQHYLELLNVLSVLVAQFLSERNLTIIIYLQEHQLKNCKFFTFST